MQEYFRLAVVALLVSSLNIGDAQASSVSCPRASKQELLKIKRESEKKKVDLVFFASWCQSCVPKIKEIKNPTKTILIGVFDDEDSISKAYDSLNTKIRCVHGDELAADTFGVKHLPYSILRSRKI